MGRQPGNAFDIYRGTQQELLKSQVVLNAALRKTVNVGEGSQKTEIKIADIDIIKAQSDPGDWLFKHLRIRAPKHRDLGRQPKPTG